MNERDERILANLPAILDGILADHRANNPNPLSGKEIRVEGGPLDGQRPLNTEHWHGDRWEPDFDGVRHRYVLGTRWTQGLAGPAETLWFYEGVIEGDPVEDIEPTTGAPYDYDRTEGCICYLREDPDWGEVFTRPGGHACPVHDCSCDIGLTCRAHSEGPG